MNPVAIGQQIKKLYPQYANVDDAVIGQKYMERFGGAVQSIQAGQIDIKDIPEAQRVGVSIGLEASGFKPKTEAEKKKESARADAEHVLTELENSFLGGNNGQSLAYGRLEGAKQKAAALAGQNPQLATYQGVRESLRPMFARAAGDVGNLSEKEQQAAVKNLPTGLSTPEEALLFFESMRKKFQLEERNLVEEFPIFAQSIDQSKLSTVQPDYIQLLGGEIEQGDYEKVAKTQEQTGLQGIAGGALGAGDFLTNLLLPETRKALTEATTKPISGGVSQQEFDQAKGDIGKSFEVGLKRTGELAQRAFPPALELAILRGAAGTLTNIPKFLQSIIHPRAVATASKAQAATEATAIGKAFPVTKEMQNAAKFILNKRDFLEPAQKNMLNAIAKGKELTPKMVNEMQPILREAGRTLTNNPLRSSEGQAFNFLYNQTLQQSKEIVPKMFQATQNIAKTFPKATKDMEPLQRFFSKIGGRGLDVGIGAGVGAGAVSLLGLLGLGNRDQ